MQQWFADPWKLCGAALLIYCIAILFAVQTRPRAATSGNYKIASPPLGAWMLLPVAAILFPIVFVLASVFAVYLWSQLFAGHTLTSAEWTQLVGFSASPPFFLACCRSLILWCCIKRRFNAEGLQWGFLAYSNTLGWSEVEDAEWREDSGLRLRLKSGKKLKITAYLNGISELAETAQVQVGHGSS
jgi:hypothetical protein